MPLEILSGDEKRREEAAGILVEPPPSFARTKPTIQQLQQRELGAQGSLRALSQSEIGELLPFEIMNRQGVTNTERWKLKWLASDPTRLAPALRAWGYHTRSYGSGFQIATNKMEFDEEGNALPPHPEKWALLDPQGNKGFGELLKDIVDLAGDVGFGTLGDVGAVLGAVSGAPAGPAGIGTGAFLGSLGGGIAAETLRQKSGQIAGIPQPIDTRLAIQMGAVQALTPAILDPVARGAVGSVPKIARTAKAAFKGAGSIQRQMSAALTGAQRGGRFISADEVMFRLSLQAAGDEPMSALSAASLYRGVGRQLRDKPWPERTTVINELSRLSKRRVDVTQFIEEMKKIDPAEMFTDRKVYESLVRDVESALEPFLKRRTVRKFVTEEGKILDAAGNPTVTMRAEDAIELVPGAPVNVPVQVVDLMKRAMDVRIKQLGGALKSETRQGASPIGLKAVRSLRRNLGQRLNATMGGDGSKFVTANTKMEQRMELLNELEFNVGTFDLDPQSAIAGQGKNPPGETFVSGIFNSETKLDLIKAIDDEFGIEMMDIALDTFPLDVRNALKKRAKPINALKRINARFSGKKIGPLEDIARESAAARAFPLGPGLAPGISVTGVPLGAQTLTSLGTAVGLGGAGFAAAGIPGSIAGAGLGLSLASPRGNLFVQRAGRAAVDRLAPLVNRIPGLGQVPQGATRAFGAGLAQVTRQFGRGKVPSATMKGILREDRVDSKRREIER